VFQPYLVVGLEGAYAELASLGPDWTNLQAGVSQLRLVPAGEPSSLPPNATYLLSGCAADKYLSGKNSIAVLWILSDSSSGFESEAGFFIYIKISVAIYAVLNLKLVKNSLLKYSLI